MRYLVRGGMSPLENMSVATIMGQNLLGSNAGNLVYQYSVCRSLMTSSRVEFVMDRYRMTARSARWVNRHCDAFVIPLADAFRPDCAKDLGRLTALVRKLDIPCIVIGAGLRAGPNTDLDGPFSFDGTVREFLDAVLQKSALVGLRGRTTACYLERLGYREGVHYQVIGCPSMYLYGAALPRQRPPEVSDGMRINVNMNVWSKRKVTRCLQTVLRDYPNSVYTAQRAEELVTMRLGRPYTTRSWIEPYPRTLDDPLYQACRVRFFVHAQAWIDALREDDLSIGGRLHGNIAAVLAGTPTVILPRDYRMTELVEYHALPHIPGQRVKEDWSLRKLLRRVVRKDMEGRHKENFAGYKAFLEANGLHHIFERHDEVAVAPLDAALSARTSEHDVVYPESRRGVSRIVEHAAFAADHALGATRKVLG